MKKIVMDKFDITSAPLKGRAVIEASAGTGKTYAIAGLFLRLVVESPLKVNQILVVTFTKAATEELRDRIRRRLRDGFNALSRGYTGNDPVLLWLVEKYRKNAGCRNRIKEALICFDESAIFTIHGFCQKLLSENAFESRTLFETELLSDDSDLTVEVCRDYYRKHFFNMDPLLLSNPQVKKITPDYLLRLINSLSIDPDFTIIPENKHLEINTDGITSVIREVEKSYSAIQKIWREEGDSIREIILTAQENRAFNGRHVRKETYIKVFSELDIYVESGSCWSIIKADGSGTASDIKKAANIEKLTTRFMVENAKDTKNRDKLPVHNLFNDIEKFIDLVDEAQKMVNLFCLSLKLDILKSAGDALQKSKTVKNVRTFDDLLISMHRAVGNGDTLMAEAVRKRFPAALIDEFQDTDPLQYSIFINIFNKGRMLLYLIGDPKQAIYGFRGADIFAYLKAKKSAESAYTLETNWRSDGGLVAAVNSLFDMKGRNPFIIDGIDFLPVSHAPDRAEGSLYIDDKASLPMNIAFVDKSLCNSQRPPGFINKGDMEEFCAKFTAGKISELINMGAAGRAVIRESDRDMPLGPQHIAVLVRTNRHSSIILQELRKLEIPGVIYSAGSVYDEEEAMEMERFMRAVAEPSNERQLKSALVTGFFGFDASQIFDLAVDETLYDSLQNEFSEYNTLWRKFGFISMLRQMMVRRGVRKQLLVYTGGERKLTNYLHIAELLHIADVKFRPGIDGLINFLAKRRLLESDNAGADAYRLRLETDEKAVRIITVHRSKGLEFPVVFCPYLYYSRDGSKEDILKFHDSYGCQTLDIGSEDFDRNRDAMIKEDFAESIRLAYVAVTRAKYACFTVWGRLNKSDKSPLSWLFHGNSINMDKRENLPLDLNGMDNLAWEDMKSDIDKIASMSDRTIGVEIVSNIKAQIYSPPEDQATELSYRNFRGGKGAVPYGWRISSFTSIFSGKESHLPDHDEMVPPSAVPNDQSVAVEAEGFFAFPRGARAGTCIHEIMERIDFTRPDIQTAADKLDKFGFKESDIGKVEEMLIRVLESDLKPGICLKQIKNEYRVNEMEFFLPVDLMDSGVIASILERYGSGTSADFASTMKSIGFLQKGGYLKGFIDLVFYHNGKYYLADWKTNHLGNTFDSYATSILNNEMRKSGYVLQYLLYTVALNAYLKNRVIDYSYDKHFGGVFYIFMRGVKPGSNTGIYFDIPDKNLIEDISAAINNSKPSATINTIFGGDSSSPLP